MATATIDLRAQATYPIRLGSSISKPATSTQYTGVRYNWKPDLRKSKDVTAEIREGGAAGESRLSVKGDDGEYTYEGKHVQDEDSFALVFRGQGKDREVVLERLSSSHAFNLTSTPTEKDASRLHPPLPADDGEEDLFGDADEMEPPDEANPFDFRHFLKAELDKPETTNTSLDATRSTVDTPLAKPAVKSAATTKTVKRAEPKPKPATKRKAPATSKANNKRVKAGEEPATAEPPKAKAKPEIPKINMDRKASLRKSSIDDSGELILENETPVTEKPKSSMFQALHGQLGNGPISLRSAASSPGSHIVASPDPPKTQETEREYVFEFDDDPEPQDEDEGDADGEDADADVSDHELPSPAQAHRPSVPAPTGDDDDDLDAQLARAMMEAEDPGQEENESEESEEE